MEHSIFVAEHSLFVREHCLFGGEHCVFVTKNCVFEGEHCPFAGHPHPYGATPSPLSEQRDALAVVPVGLREERRVLGRVHCAFAGRYCTRKLTTCPQPPSPPLVVWVSHWK